MIKLKDILSEDLPTKIKGIKKTNKLPKKFLSEQGTGAVSGFMGGGAGQGIDDVRTGPYHPDYGLIKLLLKVQLKHREAQIDWNEDITPVMNLNWTPFNDDSWKKDVKDILKVIKKRKEDEKKFITSGNEFEEVDVEINYDKIEDNKEKNQKFINPTNDWKEIYKKNSGVK